MRHETGASSLSLGQTLDQDVSILPCMTLAPHTLKVYQVVRKLADDFELKNDGHSLPLSVNEIYESIKRSNSSLARKNKRLLESSIGRVIEVLEDDVVGDGTEPIDFDLDGPEPAESSVPNAVNKKIVGMWSQSQSMNGGGPSKPDKQLKRKKKGRADERSERKKKTKLDHLPPNHVSLADLGGVDKVIQELEDLLVLPLFQPAVFTASRIQPPRGILLFGPPGCGKTMLANAFAAELGVPFITISAPSVVTGTSGESEKALRDHFEEAKRVAPCLVFIDEIDAITPKRDSANRGMEKRIVAQLLTCMDDLALEKTNEKAVIILAATNRPDSLDPALRRGGRFDKEINLSVPNESMRELILKALTRRMSISGNVNFQQLAKATPGFVGADLSDLVSTAGSAAIKRLLKDLKSEATEIDVDHDENTVSPKLRELRGLIEHAKGLDHGSFGDLGITEQDFLKALPKIQPSSKREGFATIPDTTWDDVGALDSVRKELHTAIIDPICHPERYARVGITAPTGILLWGPPGCGKTLLAKAVANQSRANFISVKGPELLNKWVGESERAVRQIFVRARSSIPCVIFFDEFDALAPKRDDTRTETSARVVNTILAELDGLGDREGIYVVAATNRPDIIDPAILRPGRLETLFFVDLPSESERVEILRTLVRKLNVEFGSQLEALARSCEGFSGADLSALLRRAGYSAIRRNDVMCTEDFVEAKKHVKPSVVDRTKYNLLKAVWDAHP